MALRDETLCQEIKYLLQRNYRHFRHEWSEYKILSSWTLVSWTLTSPVLSVRFQDKNEVAVPPSVQFLHTEKSCSVLGQILSRFVRKIKNGP